MCIIYSLYVFNLLIIWYNLENATCQSMGGDHTAYRLNVVLNDDNSERLKKAVEESGMDMSQFVRTAIQVYYHVSKEVKSGKKIYIGKDEQIERELLLVV